jgi:DNA segregation ATPase FtsK/SpoIIIE, S-DNA-T family
MATRAPEWRDSVKRGAMRSGTFLGAAALGLATFLLAVTVASYAPSDPSMNTAADSTTHNWLGVPGAWIADALLWVAGPAIILMIPLMMVATWRLFKNQGVAGWQRRSLGALGGIALIDTALTLIKPGAFENLPGGIGGAFGMIGQKLVGGLIALVPGEELIKPITWGAVAIFAVLGIIWWARSLGLDADERAWLLQKTKRDKKPKALGFDGHDDAVAEPKAPKAKPETVRERVAAVFDEPRAKPVINDKQAAPAVAKSEKDKQTAFDLKDGYTLPPISLLSPAPPSSGTKLDKAALEHNARLLETVLDDFSVKGQIVEVRPGPVVTMYELEPASGIKASRVISLADDIARNMSALSARVATIPGRSVIGIELPNAKREAVVLHELVASAAFQDMTAQLPIILGKNIAGDPVIADLAPMPHLLVAGTTGSGKSVGLNAMICSLLYRLTPEQCRMIMIDPKMLELSIYDDIPHLLSPVVTEPAKAIRALKWAVEQMEDRYRMMASVGVRSLASFNEKVKSANAKGVFLGRRVQTGYDSESGQPIYEEEELDYRPLPQIVIVVDELADLMMTAGKEVEFLIQRLAQKARAAGIHLIMATQRPSVDVITGVIKANLPTRISFSVTSKIDSRTILGEQGAEQLLGKGDMLYMPGGKQIARVHGPFVSDEEVRAIADHCRSQGTPDYIQAVTEEPEEGSWAMDGAPDGEDSAEDQLYRRALQVVAESQKASTSYVQRQLRVGYNSAARLIERMEQEGKVSRPDHVGRREVMIDRDGMPL